jgi:hypothetical protein
MRITIIAITLLCLSGCGNIYRYFSSGEVGWALKRELRDKRTQEVTIAKLTKFQWDELFLFGPYYPTSEICKRLNLTPAECKSTITSESTDDGEMLMVFRNTGKVVHTEMHIRWHGDFTPVPNKSFTPATAIFKVVVDGKGTQGQDWLRLLPIVIDK